MAHYAHRRPAACVDALGDVYQNDSNHSTRHAEPLKLWYAAIRAAYGSSGVKLEDKKHGAYSTTQPDIVRLHAVAAST